MVLSLSCPATRQRRGDRLQIERRGTGGVKPRVDSDGMSGASGILIPPDGSRAFVAATGENAIAVIDLKSLKEVARYNTGPGPDGMAWLPGK